MNRDSEAREVLALYDRGQAIAELVWTQADDPDFLDQVLWGALRNPSSGELRLAPREAFLLRAALGGIAEQLRVHFPNRGEFVR